MSFNEWEEVKISDTILTSNTGLDAIKRAPIVDYDSGIKCLRIQDISQDKSFNNWGFCSVENKNYNRFRLKKGDIIVARTGATIGVNKLIKNDLESVYNNGLIRIKVNSSIIDYRYLFYNMQGEKYKGHIQSISGGTSTQPNMKMNALLDFKINLPSLLEQKAIADTLSCLDDKIELNNRINKILEEIAQAIFKSWFVDFEPFLDGEFEDSELGRIPKGWRVENLDNIASYLNGIAMQKYRPKTEDFLPVIKIKELNQGFTDESSDKASTDIPKQFIIEDGDVLFSWSGTLMVKIWTGGTGGLNQHLFKVESEKYDKWFYYLWTLKHLERFKIIAQDKATTMGHIKRSHLTESKVIIPMDFDMKILSEILNPIFSLFVETNIQNRALKNIRESLLPKLMSGEVRVPI